MIKIAVAGFHKCGSSSLFEMLSQHPGLRAQKAGQPPNFLASEDFRASFQRIRQDYFGGCANTEALLLRDNRLAFDKPALRRLSQLSPETTLVFIVRDPAERAYSAYRHAVNRGFEDPVGFDEILHRGTEGEADGLEPPLRRYLSMGFYHEALAAAQECFPSEQIVVLTSDALRLHPATTCNTVFTAAGLSPFTVSGVQRNKAAAFRFRRLGIFLRSDSAIKRILRILLPVSARTKLIQTLHSANTIKGSDAPMTTAQRAALEALYSEPNQRLFDDFGVSFIDRGK